MNITRKEFYGILFVAVCTVLGAASVNFTTDAQFERGVGELEQYKNEMYALLECAEDGYKAGTVACKNAREIQMARNVREPK